MKYIKRMLAIVLALVICITLIPMSSASANVKTKLNRKKATVYVGKSIKLKVKNKPAGKKVTWKSTNKKVATVTKKGKVKAKKAGKATIIAKIGKKNYKCRITVKKKTNNEKPSGENNGNSENDNKPPETPSKPEQPDDSKPHEHNFVDAGVVAMDWTYANVDPNYDGPTNTHEKVSAANACVKCGYWFGSGSYFEDHYYDHIWDPNASNDCPGAYSLRTIYACYHLLECSCGAYRRGKLAYYEYFMYFDGNGNPPTHIILEDWQIKEESLPMP